jgi:hypothetical protein
MQKKSYKVLLVVIVNGILQFALPLFKLLGLAKFSWWIVPIPTLLSLAIIFLYGTAK